MAAEEVLEHGTKGGSFPSAGASEWAKGPIPPTSDLIGYPPILWVRVAEFGEDGLKGMEKNLRKTGENHYEVVVDGKTIGEVWSWHGSWSAQAGGNTYPGLKSRKKAVERVEQLHRLRDRT